MTMYYAEFSLKSLIIFICFDINLVAFIQLFDPANLLLDMFFIYYRAGKTFRNFSNIIILVRYLEYSGYLHAITRKCYSKVIEFFHLL